MKWILCALVLAGCARSTGAMNGGGGGGDLGASGSGGATGGNGATDDLALASPELGGGAQDLGAGAQDFASVAQDLAQPPAQDLAQPADLAQSSTNVVVHVLIDNFCNSSTSPTVIDAPLHVPLVLTFENDSHDYDSDIWSSRGYGYLGLVKGGVWHDPIQHCLN
ncbi:MAG TPA: hypothetical protein VF997_19700, partial [Polyangia bacterium]